MRLRSADTNIWFTADLHGYHKNITSGMSDWDDKTGCRDFSTIEKMTSTMVTGINKYVKQDDVLFFVGDWAFNGIENVWNLRNRIICDTIHFIIGNHDVHIKKDRPLANGVTTQELFETVDSYLEISIDKKPIVLSHYPIVSWNGMYKNSWHLHGHSHGTLFENAGQDHWYHKSKILDVGIDTAFAMFGEYRPFSFEEIKQIMLKKGLAINDHHDRGL